MKKRKNSKVRRPGYDLREEFEKGLAYMAAHEDVEEVVFERQLAGHSRSEDSIEIKRVDHESRLISAYLYARDSKVGKSIGFIAKITYKGTKRAGEGIVDFFKRYKKNEYDSESLGLSPA